MKKNLLLLIISICVSLVIVEFGLRWFTVFPIHTTLANRIIDNRLAFRMDPSLQDIDGNGFRNRKLFKKVDIVTIGDSHTYGNNVDLENSWPQQPAHMANMTVYNFGVGGYNGLQYYYLMSEALKLTPKHIIWGLYPVNDLKETCNLIVETDYWNQWAKESGYHTKVCFDSYRSSSLEEKKVFYKTAIGSLIMYFAVRISDKLATIKENSGSGNAIIVKDEMNPLVIHNSRISLHKRNMDLSQTDISLAFEITKDVISKSKEKADLRGTNFVILFIPSKERVFYDYLMERGYSLSDNYHKLVDNERTLINKFLSFFEESGIESVDAETFMVQEVYNSGNVYPYTDNHPLEAGYKAYAEAVYENILSTNGN